MLCCLVIIPADEVITRVASRDFVYVGVRPFLHLVRVVYVVWLEFKQELVEYLGWEAADQFACVNVNMGGGEEFPYQSSPLVCPVGEE